MSDKQSRPERTDLPPAIAMPESLDADPFEQGHRTLAAARWPGGESSRTLRAAASAVMSVPRVRQLRDA